MNPWALAALLAVVQGLTEFLPVSSSGHLVLAQTWLGFDPEAAVAFDLALHLGTLVPVLLFYRQDLVTLTRETLRGGEGRRFVGYVVLASVPTAAIGLGLEDQFKALFHDPRAVGMALLVTSALLLASRFGEGRQSRSLGVALALVLGTVQGLAITPGISRSGSTIAVALMLGLRREEAARFSFLMSVPAIGGAALLELGDLPPGLPWGQMALGFGVAAVTGYLALWALVRLVIRGRFWVFAPYVAAVGALALILG